MSNQALSFFTIEVVEGPFSLNYKNTTLNLKFHGNFDVVEFVERFNTGMGVHRIPMNATYVGEMPVSIFGDSKPVYTFTKPRVRTSHSEIYALGVYIPIFDIITASVPVSTPVLPPYYVSTLVSVSVAVSVSA